MNSVEASTEEGGSPYLIGLTDKRSRLLKGLNTTNALKDAAWSKKDLGWKSNFCGITLLTIGGSVAVMTGNKHPEAQHKGRVAWCAGLALIAAGTKLNYDGDFLFRASQELEDARELYKNHQTVATEQAKSLIPQSEE